MHRRWRKRLYNLSHKLGLSSPRGSASYVTIAEEVQTYRLSLLQGGQFTVKYAGWASRISEHRLTITCLRTQLISATFNLYGLCVPEPESDSWCLPTNMPLWWNGIHAWLKSKCRKAYRFDSCQGHLKKWGIYYDLYSYFNLCRCIR